MCLGDVDERCNYYLLAVCTYWNGFMADVVDSVKYIDTDGVCKEYPASFSKLDLELLHDFLRGGKTITMSEIFDGQRDSDTIAVRHDVDHSLDHAMKFASWEAANGFRSTYFVLHSAWYYADKERLYEQMRALQSMGHEVGLHIDGYGTYKNWPEAVSFIKYEVSSLKFQGFNIRGLAAHGGTAKHNDLQLFESGEYTPADFGVDYEAYMLMRSLPSVNYISDNHGRWRSPLIHDGRQTIVLCHPCHWPLDDV